MSEGPPTSGSGAEPEAQPAQPEVPAGWYAHPTAPGWEAYWTGSGWGTETRAAQAAAPEAPAAAEPQAETAVQPAAGTAAAAAGTGQAAQAGTAEPTPAQEASEVSAQPATDQPDATPAPADATATAGGAPPGAAATPAAAGATAAGAAAATGRSSSSLPVVLCVLGAIVAIVGCFLPLASSSFDGIDFADNTMVGQSFGIAVIAVAVLGAALAVWSHLKGNRTWLVVGAGVVIIAIAAYLGLVGIDDLSPEIPGIPTGAGGGDVQISGDLSKAINPDASPSTGIFATAVGGLLMALGGIGLARENR